MAHVYEVQTSDGRVHQVATPKHHSQSDEKTFKQHLLDVIKQTTAQILAGVVVHRFNYKGTR